MSRINILLIFLFLIITVFFSSCGLNTLPVSEEIKQESLSAVSVPENWHTDTIAGSVPGGWLKDFKDSQLEEIAKEALSNNPALQGAGAKLDRASAEAKLAGAALSPQLGVGGRGSNSAIDGVNSAINSRGAGLTASWEIDVWGRLRSQNDSAKESYEGARLDYDFARQSLVAAVAKAWFLNIELEHQKKLLKEQLYYYDEKIRIISARSKIGSIAYDQLFLEEADRLSVKENYLKADNASQQSARALEELLGRYPAAEITIKKELPKISKSVPAGLPSSLLERRPDTNAAERRVRAAFRNVEAKKLARLPRIELTASTGVASALSNITGSGAFFSVANNFFMPILDGGKIDAEIEIATADQKAALAAYGANALAAFREVEDLLSIEKLLSIQIQMLQSEMSQQKEALRIKTLEEQVGKADKLDVLNLKLKINSTKTRLLSIESAQCSQRVNLYLALGGGFEENDNLQ